MPRNYHNKGQEDASEGVFDKPHGLFSEHVHAVLGKSDTVIAENGSYDEGHSHTSEQKK